MKTYLSENKISYDIRGAIYEAYNELGPGLFESVYEAILSAILIEKGYEVKNQVALPVYYKDLKLDIGFKIDILVNNKVIIEIKSVTGLNDIHHKQLLTYLRLSNKKLGLLVNFNTDDLNKSIIRIVNGL